MLQALDHRSRVRSTVAATLTVWRRRIYQAMKSIHARQLDSGLHIRLSTAQLMGRVLGKKPGTHQSVLDEETGACSDFEQK